MSINYNYFQNCTHLLVVNYQEAIYCNCTGWYLFTSFETQARRHVFKSGPAVFRASAEGTSGGGEHERGCRPSRKGGSGDLPREKLCIYGCLYLHFNAFCVRISAG